MGNAIALVVQPIAKALSLNAHSDENLIKAIGAGDEGAMRTLYARHNVRVFRFISRLVTEPGTAEDLVSEVLTYGVRPAVSKFARRSRPGFFPLRASKLCRRCTAAAAMPS